LDNLFEPVTDQDHAPERPPTSLKIRLPVLLPGPTLCAPFLVHWQDGRMLQPRSALILTIIHFLTSPVAHASARSNALFGGRAG